MTKLNPTTIKTQYDGQYDTFCRKNHDYGNSFEESLDQFGIVASIVRMSDKMKRLESLTDESKTQQVGSESLLDTLEDLSNYAAMTACWLKGVGAEDEVVETSSCNEDEKKLIELLQRSFHISCHRHEFTMNHKMYDMWDDIINSIANILINENVSQERFEELEELFVKQNEHIKVLMLSGAGKTYITPLAILDYKSKTSEAVNGYDLMVALDCLIPNLSKEGLEHFIQVASDTLAKKG